MIEKVPFTGYDIRQMQPDNLPELASFKAESAHSFHLDVRELLRAGGEPYSAIMSCVRQLEPGQTLFLHALFEPLPLIRKLERRGLALAATHVGPDHWRVSILRPPEA